MKRSRHLWVGIVALAASAFGAPSFAADVVSEWASVKAPPVPELKPVAVDPKTTALLILDMQIPGCARSDRPRCADSIPAIKTLMDRARARGMMVLYTFSRGKPKEIADPGLAPHDGEWIGRYGPDKFQGSDLDERLKARGVKTVIVTGFSAQGAVLGTSTDAALKGYKLVLPVDGISSETPYQEQYSLWQLFKGGPAAVTAATTLTRSDMITF